MAKIGSGKRGRPIEIDPQRELEKFITKDVKKMQARLAEIRKETSGERSEAFIGSETSFPDWVQETLDILQDMQENSADIDYATAKHVKANLKAMEQLASKQERVWGRALENILTQDYLNQLIKSTEKGSEFTKKMNEQYMKKLLDLTPQQRQKFYFSRQYQDIRTQTNGKYEHIVAWADEKTGQELTLEESWAVLRYQRFLDFGEEISRFERKIGRKFL